MLTFGALRRNHTVSTAFEAIAGTETKRHLVHVRSAIYHEMSRTQLNLEGNCVSVASMRWLLRDKKKDVASMMVLQNNTTSAVVQKNTLQGIYLHYGTYQLKGPDCNHFDQNGTCQQFIHPAVCVIVSSFRVCKNC